MTIRHQTTKQADGTFRNERLPASFTLKPAHAKDHEMVLGMLKKQFVRVARCHVASRMSDSEFKEVTLKFAHYLIQQAKSL